MMSLSVGLRSSRISNCTNLNGRRMHIVHMKRHKKDCEAAENWVQSKWKKISGNYVNMAFIGAITVAHLVEPLPAKAEIASVYALADGSLGDWFGGILYSAGQQANEAVLDQLSSLSFTSLAVIFGAGLVTSLSPCTLSVLPLTLGYIGAFGSGKSRTEVLTWVKRSYIWQHLTT